jgi:hypothetical protein
LRFLFEQSLKTRITLTLSDCSNSCVDIRMIVDIHPLAVVEHTGRGVEHTQHRVRPALWPVAHVFEHSTTLDAATDKQPQNRSDVSNVESRSNNEARRSRARFPDQSWD